MSQHNTLQYLLALDIKKEEATTGAFSVESQMSRKGPKAERMRRMQMIQRGGADIHLPVSVDNCIFSTQF